MADLDTRSKRTSGAHLLKAWMTAPVTPDGTIGQGDRQHIALMYSGILASAPGGGGAVTRTITVQRGLRVDAFNPNAKMIQIGGRRRLGGG